MHKIQAAFRIAVYKGEIAEDICGGKLGELDRTPLFQPRWLEDLRGDVQRFGRQGEVGRIRGRRRTEQHRQDRQRDDQRRGDYDD